MKCDKCNENFELGDIIVYQFMNHPSNDKPEPMPVHAKHFVVGKVPHQISPRDTIYGPNPNTKLLTDARSTLTIDPKPKFGGY